MVVRLRRWTMDTDWDEFGPAPAAQDPMTTRDGTRTETYPAASGGAFPEGWSVTEWITDFENTPFYEEYEDHVDKGMELPILLRD
jgi:hypothetical protein